MKKTTLFREILGNSTQIKVIEFFLEGRGLSYSEVDVKQSLISPTVTGDGILKIMQHLLEKQIIIKTRMYKKIQLYSLNDLNPVSKQLFKLYDIIR